MAYRECICCGIIIETPFWLCQTCEDVQGVAGLDYRHWPGHLKARVNQAKRDEYRARRLGLVSLNECSGIQAQIDGALWEDVPQVYDPKDKDAGMMAYAPYEDEPANRAYRLANGIREHD